MPLRPALFTLALLAAMPAAARDREASAVVIDPGATAPAPDVKLSERGRSFAPLHSTLLGQGGVARLDLSGALSIRNASATSVLMVEKIDYRNGAGDLIESYLAEPVFLKPYAAMQVVIAQGDVRGGVGASFTVDWSVAPGADAPEIDAAMAGFVGTRSFSFVSPGRRVSRP
jgi:hypothetical protein